MLFRSAQIGPWSLWQGNLDAEIMVIGQDWGDKNYFTKNKGHDQGAKSRERDTSVPTGIDRSGNCRPGGNGPRGRRVFFY